MGLGGCYNILKFFVIFINTIFFITGVVITGVCAWFLVDQTYPVVQDANNSFYGFTVLLVVGILLAIVGLLGCCGACKESQCLLVSFFCVLLIVVVAQIATIVWAFINADQLHELFKTTMDKTVVVEYGSNAAETNSFNVIQKELQCCGAQGPMDWATSKYGGGEGKNVVNLSVGLPEQKYLIPASCCRVSEDDALCEAGRHAVIGAQVSEVIFSDGCLNILYNYVESYRPLLLSLSITAALLELFGLVLTIILCCAVRVVDRYKG